MYTLTDLCPNPPRDWKEVAALKFAVVSSPRLRMVTWAWLDAPPHDTVRGPFATEPQVRPSQDEILAPDYMVYKEGVWERRASGTGVLLDMGERPNNFHHGY